jgi:hypothetical protein
MADALSMASTCAVCSHTDDAVGYVIPGCVGLFPEGASCAPWVSVERERKAMPSAKRLWIAVVMLLLCWRPSAIGMDQPGLQERKGNPSSRSAVTQEPANMPQESSPIGSVTKKLLSSHGPASVQWATPCCAPRDDHRQLTVPPLLSSRPVCIGMPGQKCIATFLLRFQHCLSSITRYHRPPPRLQKSVGVPCARR